MKIEFATNLYDEDGEMYNQCILLFIEDRTVIKFKSLLELRNFATAIREHVIPEIIEQCSDELSEEDQADFL